MEEEAPLSPIRFIRTRCRYRQAKDAHTLICTHRHALLDVCVCMRMHTHTNKTARMHACTHLSVCIQVHIHVDKLIYFAEGLSSTFPLQSQICSPMRCAESLPRKGLLWPQLVPTTKRVRSSPEEWSYQLKAG